LLLFGNFKEQHWDEEKQQEYTHGKLSGKLFWTWSFERCETDQKHRATKRV